MKSEKNIMGEGKELKACREKWGKNNSGTDIVSSIDKQTKINTDKDETISEKKINNDKKEIKINNDIDKNDIVKKSYDIPDFVPSNYKEEVALEICESFNDRQNLKAYLYCVNYCGTDKALRIAALVKETPDDKIKKNRGAMFVQYMLHEKKVDKKK